MSIYIQCTHVQCGYYNASNKVGEKVNIHAAIWNIVYKWYINRDRKNSSIHRKKGRGGAKDRDLSIFRFYYYSISQVDVSFVPSYQAQIKHLSF